MVLGRSLTHHVVGMGSHHVLWLRHSGRRHCHLQVNSKIKMLTFFIMQQDEGKYHQSNEAKDVTKNKTKNAFSKPNGSGYTHIMLAFVSWYSRGRYFDTI